MLVHMDENNYNQVLNLHRNVSESDPFFVHSLFLYCVSCATDYKDMDELPGNLELLEGKLVVDTRYECQSLSVLFHRFKLYVKYYLDIGEIRDNVQVKQFGDVCDVWRCFPFYEGQGNIGIEYPDHVMDHKMYRITELVRNANATNDEILLGTLNDLFNKYSNNFFYLDKAVSLAVHLAGNSCIGETELKGIVSHAVTKNRKSSISLKVLGEIYGREGNDELAAKCYKESLKIRLSKDIIAKLDQLSEVSPNVKKYKIAAYSCYLDKQLLETLDNRKVVIKLVMLLGKPNEKAVQRLNKALEYITVSIMYIVFVRSI